MKKLQLLCILLISVVWSSCKEDPFCNCFQRTGSTTYEIRNTEDFTFIEVENNIDLEITPDTFNQVMIVCGDNLIDGIEVRCSNGNLTLKNKNKCNWMRNPKNNFLVQIHAKNLDHVIARGSGDITFKDSITISPFTFESRSGMGKYSFLFNSQKAELMLHSGSGDVYVNGTIHDIYFYSGANGFIHADYLNADICTVYTLSSGDSYVNAANTLSARIDYLGNVYYRGNPTTATSSGVGPGKLIQIQ